MRALPMLKAMIWLTVQSLGDGLRRRGISQPYLNDQAE